MIVIQPDGTITRPVYVDYTSIVKAVNPPGRDDPFTSVPLPGGTASGYTVWANDVGLLIGMDENPYAEDLCEYMPLVGPICITSFEESKEDELLGDIVREVRQQFEDKLNALLAKARAATAARDN